MVFPKYSWKYVSSDKNFKPARSLLSRMDFAVEFKKEDYAGESKEVQQLVNSDVEEWDSSIIYTDRVLTHMQGNKIYITKITGLKNWAIWYRFAV